MINPTQYIFVNQSLGMSPGKVAAQVAHAQEELTWEYLEHRKDQIDDYRGILGTNPRTAIVLDCLDSEQIYKIANYVESLNLLTGIYVDEGGDSYLLEATAMALEYVEKGDPRLAPLFSKFSLYDPKSFREELEKEVDRIEEAYFWKRERWEAIKRLCWPNII